jgi:hypothetical protein
MTPYRLVMRDASVSRDQGHGTGEAASGDVPVHQLADPHQTLRR